MNWEQYMRSNFSPKYSSYNSNCIRSYNEDREARIWSGYEDLDEYNAGRTTESHVPWKISGVSTREKREVYKRGKLGELFTPKIIPLPISTEGIRADEEFYNNENGAVIYHHDEYYREYFRINKSSFITFYGDVCKHTLKNLEKGDVLCIATNDDWKIEDITDYKQKGVMYKLKNTQVKNDYIYLEDFELIYYLKHGTTPPNYNL